MGNLFEKAVREPVAPNGTVLVVEDESMVRDCASAIFSALGFEVIQACDGMEAFEIYQEQGTTIALVFMDIAMPRMDGITATRKIREFNPSAKVILTSGGFADHQLSDAKPDAFLPKPYRHKTLHDLVQRVMQPGFLPCSSPTT